MERYYNSVDDTTAFLTKDAKELLTDKGDVVSFYQACGSGYIRSIRRTAEVTAIFKIDSSTEETAKSLAGSIGAGISGVASVDVGFKTNSTSFQKNEKIEIKIKAFGLGLNMEGADTMVARNQDDYMKAMNFAFKSMQNQNVGMIRGIEVVPWMDNLQFQNALNFKDVHQRTEIMDTNGVPFATPQFENSLIPKLEVKEITSANGEFVQMIGAKYREFMYNTALMSACVGEIELLWLNDANHNKFMLDHTGFDMILESSGVTLTMLREAIDHDALVKMFADAKGYIRNFYGPCIKGILKHSEFGPMTKWFFEVPECQYNLACISPNAVMKDLTNVAPSPQQEFCEDELKADTLASDKLKTMTLSTILASFCLPEIDTLNSP
jgi:hypothetical protein